MSKLDDFLDEIVKVHMKQLDPEAIVEEEQSAPVSWSEMVFIGVILLLVCYIAADYLYPYFETYVLRKKKKRPLPKAAGPRKKG
mmetsp:Transcript_33468/g.69845  ORF Transcript_33468/g.69845 Transcript_33468/m.69845 type:complete len:84 (-) Transcript_33468:192-443(-)|eukprot:s1140_g6.t1